MSDECNNEKKLRIGFVDVNYIVSQSKQVQELKNETALKNKELQIWLSKVNTEVMEQNDVQQQQQLINQYNIECAQKQEKIKSEYNLKLQQIDVDITKIIADEAKKLNYDFVFAKGTVLFGGEDITVEIANLLK